MFTWFMKLRIDGTMETDLTTFQIYFLADSLTSQNAAEFDHTYDLPGSLWNSYLIWSHPLITNNFAEECAGFCHFQHPDPVPCTFNVVNELTSTCFMGSFVHNGDGLPNSFIGFQSFSGRVVSSNFFCGGN